MRGNRFIPQPDGEENSTLIIPSVTPIGELTDIMKNYPAFSLHDLMWNLSAPFVKCMLADATQVMYLTENQKKEYKEYKRKQNKNIAMPQVTDDPDVFSAALGIPSF